MNPDAAKAIPEFARRGIISRERASLLLRIACGDLVTVHREIRLLFYLGVLLTTTGVGLLVQRNYRHIGPVTIAVVIGAGAVACLSLAAKRAQPFSWMETPSPSLGFDYLLLLGVLLAGADLAFIEIQFTPLGAHWPWHLLIVSVLMACIAVRYDSRTVFSIALSTFAAWRGLSVSFIEKPVWLASEESVRMNSLGCGVLFVLLGSFLVRGKKKPHFEPVAVHLGWFLILGALVSGIGGGGAEGIVYIALLSTTGAFLAWRSYSGRRFGLFAFGVFAVYLAAIGLVFKAGLGFSGDLACIMITSVVLIALLWKAQKKMKEPV